MLNTHTVNSMKTKKNEATAMHTRYTARYPVMREQSRSLVKVASNTWMAVGMGMLVGSILGRGMLGLYEKVWLLHR